MRRLAAILLVLTGSAAAAAHDSWGNGKPIPGWVLKSCCGLADAHRLRADQVHRVEGGYRIDGYPTIVYDAQVVPSEDGDYWAFYSEFTDADGVRSVSSIYCFFVPMSG